jgi:uncharacterized protein YndB with AHSA1/START domain
MSQTASSERIVEEITIKAPAERVFEAIASPTERVQWWGSPGRFEVTQMESDLRPGGAWMMRGLRGGAEEFSIRGEYRAVERPRVLEFTWQPDWPEPPTVVRFDLREEDGVTTVRVTHSGFNAEFPPSRYQGWPWLLGALRGHVEHEA